MFHVMGTLDEGDLRHLSVVTLGEEDLYAVLDTTCC